MDKKLKRWYELVYNPEEQKWQCSNCGATYCPEEVKRVWDYSIAPVVEELENNPAAYTNFVPCHCMDCGTIWYNWKIEG